MQGDGEINALFSGIKGAQTPLGASSLKEPFAIYNYAVCKPDALYLYALTLHIKAYFTQNTQVSYFVHFLWFYILSCFDLNVKNLTF